MKKELFVSFFTFFLGLIFNLQLAFAQSPGTTFEITIDKYQIPQSVVVNRPQTEGSSSAQLGAGEAYPSATHRHLYAKVPALAQENHVRGSIQVVGNRLVTAEAAVSAIDARYFLNGSSDSTSYQVAQPINVKNCSKLKIKQFSYDYPAGGNPNEPTRLVLKITLYDASDLSGGTWSAWTLPLRRIYNNEDIEFDLLAPTEVGPDGPANLERVGAFEQQIFHPQNNLVFSNDTSDRGKVFSGCVQPTPTPTPAATATPAKPCVEYARFANLPLCSQLTDSRPVFLVNNRNAPVSGCVPSSGSRPILSASQGSVPNCLRGALNQCGGNFEGNNRLMASTACVSQCLGSAIYGARSAPFGVDAFPSASFPHYRTACANGALTLRRYAFENHDRDWRDGLYSLEGFLAWRQYYGQNTLYFQQQADGTCSRIAYNPSQHQICSRSNALVTTTNFARWQFASPVVLEWEPSESHKIDVGLYSDFPLIPGKKGLFYKWMAGSQVAFVAWLPKGAKDIKDATQLFGNNFKFTGAEYVKYANLKFADGFEALRHLDKNKDGKLSASEMPAELVLAFDIDKNGRFDKIIPAKESGLIEISLNPEYEEPTYGSLFSNRIGFRRVVNEGGKQREIVGLAADFFSPALKHDPRGNKVSEDVRDLVAGFWEWSMPVFNELADGSIKEESTHGVLAFDPLGKNLLGRSLIEFAVNGPGVDRMVEHYPIVSGEIVERAADGSVKIVFTVAGADGVLNENTATISADGKNITGKTVALGANGEQVLEYHWSGAKMAI
ncbi:MAG TPA: hypothetical protein PKA79_06890 [Oligoflexia bacterium]|nr:hypothetical protein [Oligoflexia bacterium]